jgi:hypothetical protein
MPQLKIVLKNVEHTTRHAPHSLMQKSYLLDCQEWNEHGDLGPVWLQCVKV